MAGWKVMSLRSKWEGRSYAAPTSSSSTSTRRPEAILTGHGGTMIVHEEAPTVWHECWIRVPALLVFLMLLPLPVEGRLTALSRLGARRRLRASRPGCILLSVIELDGLCLFRLSRDLETVHHGFRIRHVGGKRRPAGHGSSFGAFRLLRHCLVPVLALRTIPLRRLEVASVTALCVGVIVRVARDRRRA